MPWALKRTQLALGRVAARIGERDEAFRLINEALDNGLVTERGMNMRDDPELASPIADPRFDALDTRAKSRASARK